jgi:hypothetical protein
MCNLICEQNMEQTRDETLSFKLAPKDCRNGASVICSNVGTVIELVISLLFSPRKGRSFSEPEPRNAASAALINKQKDR